MLMHDAPNNPNFDVNSVYDNPNNLVDLWEQSAVKYAGNKLFGKKNAAGLYDYTTYGAVAERVNALRGALKQKGLTKGDTVGVIISNCEEWFICEQAVHGLGGVFVPMYEKELEKIWRYIIADSAIKFLFVRESKMHALASGFKKDIPTLKEVFMLFGTGPDTLAELEAMGKQKPAPSIKPKWSDMANIIYTSGTTGDPKGVMLHHGSLTLCARTGAWAFDLDQTMNVVAILPWAHAFGLSCDLHVYIYCGGAMAFAESAELLMKNIAEAHPTGLSAVPLIFNRVYDGIQLKMSMEGGLKKKLFDAACAEAVKNRGREKKTLKFKILNKLVFSKIREIFGGRLTFVVSGGGAMKKEIALFFADLGQPIYDGYGLSETAPNISGNNPKSGLKYGTVGKVFPNMHVYIDKSLVGENSPDGEICAYGAQIMMGYLNKPEQTAAIMMPDKWNGFPGIRTGDRGYLDEEGFLHITGRFKDEYKLLNGKYVHPESIENEMKLLRYVSSVMLYGEGRDYNVAIVVPNFEAMKVDPQTAAWSQGTPAETIAKKEVTDFLGKTIMAHLGKTYGGYEVPKKFLFLSEDFTIESGMLTQTSKLKRNLVMQKYGEKLLALYNEK